MKKNIYDIARELNVAPSTVSKALNNTAGISDKMRKRVINYCNEVRYFPNSNAAKLKTKQSHTIGVVFSENLGVGLEHRLFSSVLQSFKTYVEDKGYEISFVVTNLGGRKITYKEYCEQKNIHGVFIVTSFSTDPYIEELLKSEVSCVTTDIYKEGLYTIMSDNFDGACQAVEYLNNLGFDRIGHIKGNTYSTAAKERLAGYLSKMKELHIPIEEEFIVESAFYSVDYGYKAGIEYLSKDNYPKSVFIVSDEVAVGFLKAMKEKGFKAPDDISIIGFDDLDYVKHINPSLTTIRQNTKILGEEAAIKLLDLMNNDLENKTGFSRIPVQLIKRDSTR